MTTTTPAPAPVGRHLGPSGTGEDHRAAELVGSAEVSKLLGRRTVTVCVIPRTDTPTTARIVEGLAVLAGHPPRVVDELVVMHSCLGPRASRRLQDAGARVVSGTDVCSDLGPPIGRGDLMWRSLWVTTGDIVVWLDGDLENFDDHVVLGLIAALAAEPSVAFARPTAIPGRGAQRPAPVPAVERSVLVGIDPAFAHLRDTVGGECAIRRDVAENLAFEPDDGVEIGLLADVAERYGADTIREVDLGRLRHSGRSPHERARQLRQTMRAALSRLGAPRTPSLLPLRPARAIDPSVAPKASGPTTEVTG